MKKTNFGLTLVLAVFVLSLTIVESGHALMGMGKSIYDFKNAEIVLETIAPMSKIIQKISVGEGGKYLKEETTSEINAFGMKRKETQISYVDRTKNIVYQYNPATNEATATDMTGVMEGAKKQNMYAFNDESLKKWKGKVLRKEKYKELDCTVVEFKEFMSTVWFHKKYPVRTISNFGGMETKTELVSFKEGAAKDYKLPAKAIIGETKKLDDIMAKMNAYKNDPEYQENQDEMDDGYDPENMPDLQKSMDEAGPKMEDAMKALSDMFGNN